MTEKELLRHKYRAYDARGYKHADKLYQTCFYAKDGPKNSTSTSTSTHRRCGPTAHRRRAASSPR